MENNVENTVTDLIAYLFYELKSRNMPVSEFNMQKLIYKIKMDLGEKHELYSKLPFYWYLKGPYSDVVTESFNSFMPMCNIINGSFIYKHDVFDDYNVNNSSMSQYLEIQDILQEIIVDNDFFYNQLDKEIYKDYAPYKFMYSYKYEIYDVAMCSDVVNFDIDAFIDTMYHCEGNLPCDIYFNEFNSLYSNLSLNMDLIFKANNFEKYWNFIQKPITGMWETFAKGVRVNFKDKFYENHVDLWNKEFNRSLFELSSLINETKNLIDFGEYFDEDYAAEEVKMINNTLDSYLAEYENV